MNKKIVELEELIKYHKALYYQGKPEIHDHEYDSLEDELRSLDSENPVLSIVGSIHSKLDKVEHATKMLSLNKTYVYEDLVKWVENNEVISMHKIDGVSCSIIYENGSLKLAKTRGDGQFGEDITQKILWLSNLPKKIKSKDKIEVRGELFCTEENFLKLSDEMFRINLDRPSSQRNIVAGLLGRKDNVELSRYLTFYAFDFITEAKILEKESQKFTQLEKEGFNTPSYILHKDEHLIKSVIDEAQDFMLNGNYQIDGIVFCFNDITTQEELGNTSHHPRFKMAFKFAGESKITKIKSISWQVSRNGILTPIANVEPVELAGAMISRVTLHNYGMVKNHNLKMDDEISIIRSGEVIPKFLSVNKEGSSPFEIPSNCPSCAEKVFIEDIRIICRNPECPAQLKEGILNFIQKIGIDDLSEKRLDELIDKRLVQSIEDLFKIEVEDFYKLDKVKEKLANKLYESIRSVMKVDLVTFLSALGLRGGAYNKCEKIVLNGFDTIEKIKSLTLEQLVNIDGFAEKSAKEILASLKEKHNLINNLLNLGFEIKSDEKGDSPILLKKICITGSLSRKRSEIENVIRERGGVVSSSVSKNTDYLLTNDKEGTSSKFKKAISLGISIISEEDFFLLIENK